MPIQVHWDNAEQTIIRLVYQGKWTWEDLYAANAQAYDLIDSVAHIVDVIIDVRASSILPSSALTHARGLDRRRHERVGLTIAVGASRLIQSMTEIFKRLVPNFASHYALVATLDEARTLVAKTRQVA